MSDYTAQELQALAYTLLGEAEEGGAVSMNGVAHVIRNRMDSGLFPTNGYDVIMENDGKEFAATKDLSGAIRRNPEGSKLYNTAMEIVKRVIVSDDPGPDPTGRAIFYGIPTAKWKPTATKYGTVGDGLHLFYAREPQETSFNDALTAIANVTSGVTLAPTPRPRPKVFNETPRALTPGTDWKQVILDHAAPNSKKINVDNINPVFGEQVAAAILAADAATGDKILIWEGQRPNEVQAQYRADYLQQPITYNGVVYKPNPNNKGHKAAPVGKSNHLGGNAMDIGYDENTLAGKAAREWLIANASRYGIDHPMPGDDPPHFEFVGKVALYSGPTLDTKALGYAAEIGAIVDAHRNPPPVSPANLIRGGLAVEEALSVTPVLHWDMTDAENAQLVLTNPRPAYDAVWDAARGAFITRGQALNERGISADGKGPWFPPYYGPPTHVDMTAIDFAMAAARVVAPAPTDAILHPSTAVRPDDHISGLPVAEVDRGLTTIPVTTVPVGADGNPLPPNRAAPDHPSNAYPSFNPPLEGQALFDARVRAGQVEDPNALIDVGGILGALADWIGVNDANEKYKARVDAGLPTDWAWLDSLRPAKATPYQPVVAGREGVPGGLPASPAPNRQAPEHPSNYPTHVPYQPVVAGRPIDAPGVLPGYKPVVAGRPDLPGQTVRGLAAARTGITVGGNAIPVPDLPRKRPATPDDPNVNNPFPAKEYTTVNGKTYEVGGLYWTKGGYLYEAKVENGVGKFEQVTKNPADEAQLNTWLGGYVRGRVNAELGGLEDALGQGLGDAAPAIEKLLGQGGGSTPNLSNTSALEASLVARRVNPGEGKPAYVPVVAGREGVPGGLPAAAPNLSNTADLASRLAAQRATPGAVRSTTIGAARAGDVAMPPGARPASIPTPAQRIDDAVNTHRSYDVVYMQDRAEARVIRPIGAPTAPRDPIITARPETGASAPANIVKASIAKALVEQAHTTVKSTVPATVSQPVVQKVGGTGVSGNPANYPKPPTPLPMGLPAKPVKIPTPAKIPATIKVAHTVTSYVNTAATIAKNNKQLKVPDPVVATVKPNLMAGAGGAGGGTPPSKLLAGGAAGAGATQPPLPPPVPVGHGKPKPKLRKVTTTTYTIEPNPAYPKGGVQRQARVYDANGNAILRVPLAEQQTLVRKNGFVFTQNADGSLTPTAAAAKAIKRQALTGGDGMDRSAAGDSFSGERGSDPSWVSTSDGMVDVSRQWGASKSVDKMNADELSQWYGSYNENGYKRQTPLDAAKLKALVDGIIAKRAA